jgi:hypothetical protein
LNVRPFRSALTCPNVAASCALTPSATFVSLRELMFRSAVGTANWSRRNASAVVEKSLIVAASCVPV